MKVVSSSRVALYMRIYIHTYILSLSHEHTHHSRPLPAEMERYAREDTHYLLYIYDRMRNELIRRKKGSVDPLLTTLERSRDVCLRTYQKPLSRDQDYLKLYNKHKLSFNSQQVRGSHDRYLTVM